MKLILTALAAIVAGAVADSTCDDGPSKPNIIVILTDDQDLQLNSMSYMPGVKRHLTDEGTYFNHHFATISLCCPSRANMWTGKAAHNTNVTDLTPPYGESAFLSGSQFIADNIGGYPKFIQEGYNTKWLPVWLQEAGYQTYFTGKLMNGHTTENFRPDVGDLSLDGHDFMLEPGTYQYTNTTIQHNQEEPKTFPGVYATDLLANRSLAWIDHAVQNSSAPFFLAFNPVNPHNNLDWATKKFTPPIPAERHAKAFPNVTVPRTSSFNPDKPSGASWVKKLQKLSEADITSGDEYYRRRLQALLAVDDLVNQTIARLEQHGVLDNTYVIYTSDNGFHIGQHRLGPGKRCPYEEDISVPLVIRGPGVPKAATIDFVTTHTDITPTIVELAGAKGPGDFDGVAIPLQGGVKTSSSQQNWEHVQVEFWGSSSDGTTTAENAKINTYKAIRVIAQNYSLYYSVWCSGDHELYDMINDPHQMNNLYGTSEQILGVSVQQLQDRLDALTLVLKTCTGKTCHDPWTALDPSGQTTSLLDALDTKYNSFYKNQNKVKFEHCAAGYFINNELPIDYLTFGNHSTVESRNAEALENWSLFTD